jgi:hypothetical protein
VYSSLSASRNSRSTKLHQFAIDRGLFNPYICCVYFQSSSIRMKKRKPRFLFRLVVVFFVLGYVSGSVANLLIIPRYVPEVSKIGQSSATMISLRPRLSDLQSVNPVRILDRTATENTSGEKFCPVPRILQLQFSTRIAGQKEPKFNQPQNHALYNFRNIYLSLCTFRI